ncbi:MAG: hypothetical protein HYY00_08040 [Chloroflexi bacterium]|nr:hypothetical protein [Chloroflexota bacterium]
MAKCPVCGLEVNEREVNQAVGSVAAGAPQTDPAKGTKRFHDGSWYYFDTLACRAKFMGNPEAYLPKA